MILSVSYPGYYIPHARSARLFPEDAAEAAAELEAGPSASGSGSDEVEGVGEKAVDAPALDGAAEKRRWWNTRRA